MGMHFVVKNDRPLLDELVARALSEKKPICSRGSSKLCMHLTRFMDDKMGKLVRQNKGATFHLSVSGHEMIGAVSALSLLPGTDWGFPLLPRQSVCDRTRLFHSKIFSPPF